MLLEKLLNQSQKLQYLDLDLDLDLLNQLKNHLLDLPKFESWENSSNIHQRSELTNRPFAPGPTRSRRRPSSLPLSLRRVTPPPSAHSSTGNSLRRLPFRALQSAALSDKITVHALTAWPATPPLHFCVWTSLPRVWTYLCAVLLNSPVSALTAVFIHRVQVTEPKSQKPHTLLFSLAL